MKRGQLERPAHCQGELEVLAAIPCFNTAPFIGDVISRTQRHVKRVIVIDDGSQDGTAEVARRAGAEVVSHSSNRGYGEAIRSCFEAAKASTADVLVILDGDGQHDPDDIPRVLGPIVRGEADLVIGSRFIANEHSMPRYRRLGISIITLIWNLGVSVTVSDTQSGFRAYCRPVFESFSLSEKGMGVSIEILEKARRKRSVIRESPVSCSYTSSRPNLNAVRHGLSVALAVIRLRLRRRV